MTTAAKKAQVSNKATAKAAPAAGKKATVRKAPATTKAAVKKAELGAKKSAASAIDPKTEATILKLTDEKVSRKEIAKQTGLSMYAVWACQARNGRTNNKAEALERFSKTA